MQAVFSGNGTGILDATAFPVSSYATLPDEESYYAHQLITYIGNKRSFIRPIHQMIEVVKARLGRKKLRAIDLFSGSGVVARLLKGHSNYLVVNDLEDYARVISQCYLANKSQLSHKRLRELLFQLNSVAESGSRLLDPETPPVGFIEELYAPKDEKNLTSDDRVFYTRQNARRLDLYRQGISHLTAECGEYAGYLPYVLAPLLSGASVHTNTAGVFKGFYKNRETKIGQFGGSGADALSRIMGKIMLQAPRSAPTPAMWKLCNRMRMKWRKSA
ncbi:MAG: DNA adenine methylase [Zavarzinella sp.]